MVRDFALFSRLTCCLVFLPRSEETMPGCHPYKMTPQLLLMILPSGKNQFKLTWLITHGAKILTYARNMGIM